MKVITVPSVYMDYLMSVSNFISVLFTDMKITQLLFYT